MTTPDRAPTDRIVTNLASQVGFLPGSVIVTHVGRHVHIHCENPAVLRRIGTHLIEAADLLEEQSIRQNIQQGEREIAQALADGRSLPTLEDIA
jgi:hypothetical protein